MAEPMAIGRAFTQAFAAAARSGVLLMQVCEDCGATNPYVVTEVCHRCGGIGLHATPSRGAGEIVSWTDVRRPSDASLRRRVVLIDLDEGVRVLGIADDGWQITIGERVEFTGREPQGGALVFGRPKPAEAS